MRTACIVLVVCLLTGCEEKPAGKGGGTPTPVKSGAPAAGKFKNATELADFLNSKGVKVKVGLSAIRNQPNRPCSELTRGPATVEAYLCKNDAEAAELAGASGPLACTSGRFALVPFEGQASEQLAKDIKQALR